MLSDARKYMIQYPYLIMSPGIAIILMAVLTLFNLMVNNSLAALICFITTVVVAYRGYQTYLNGPDDQDKTEEGSDQF